MRVALLFASIALAGFVAGAPLMAKEKAQQSRKLSPLEEYLEQARRVGNSSSSPTPGSAWSPEARLYDIATDLRASRVNDIVTVLVEENAVAVSQGTVASQRDSSASSSVSALAGIPHQAGALRNLLGLESKSNLQGKGETSRRTVLTATMAARVVEVLPGGNLVVEGEKKVVVNSEEQILLLRGVVRPYDVSVLNTVSSAQIAQMELKVNGKGVVGDAIRRPNFLYRFLLGLLPF